MNNPSRLTIPSVLSQTRHETSAVMWLLIAGSLLAFGLLVAWYQSYLLDQATRRVKNHAEVVTSSLWTFEKPSPNAYLQLAFEANGYQEVTVLQESGKVFLHITGAELSPFEKFLHSLRLIPLITIEDKIFYEKRVIGKILVVWPCRAIYLYLYVFWCATLLLVGIGLYLNLLDTKRNLEDRVRQRTADLENEVQERKKAEENQRRQAERLALHVQHTPMGVIEWDLDFKVVDWNRAAEVIFEYPRSEALGKSAFELILPEDEFEKISEVWEKLTSQGGGTQSNNTNRTKTGKIKYCRWYNTILTDYQNKVFGVASLVLDDTEKTLAEMENRKLQGQLAQVQKMEAVGNLAGGVAHDFNNMLSVILGHVELAMNKVDNSHPLIANLQEIGKAARRSADITRQLLAFARKQTVDPQVVNLNEIVEGMLKMLYRLIGEGVNLGWSPEADLWPVKMDPSQIDQILVNLCVNARDALTVGIGKITVETGNAIFDTDYCRLHSGFVPGSYVRISVSDNGCGMDKETLSHIFEPFFTTKAVGEGTGLGLATIYGIVKQNDGFINVYSEQGQGTTVSIYLPRYEGGDEKAREEEQEQPAVMGSETILLVEDESMILEMVASILKQLGYAVLAAKSPSEAISLFELNSQSIDLLITDVIMPEMNGRNLAMVLREKLPNLKCLFISGYTGKVIATHGILNKGVPFIQKPFTVKELADKIRSVFTQAPVEIQAVTCILDCSFLIQSSGDED